MSARPDTPAARQAEAQAEALVRLTLGDREELIEYLESDQLVTERSRPVGRRGLSPPVGALLLALRVFVIVVGVMVIYTFFAHLGG